MSEPRTSHRAILQTLIWAFVVPQALLLFLNWRAWTLISGEASALEALRAFIMAGGGIGILIANAAVTWLVARHKFVVGWKTSAASLAVHAGYMLMVLFYAHEIIPNNIQFWILHEGNVGRWNITLMMPAAFVSLFALTRFYADRFEPLKGTLLALAGVVGVPLIWFIVTTVAQPLWLGQYWVVIAILAATVFLGGLIHLIDNVAYKYFASQDHERHYIVAVVLGFAAPLAGLALNSTIPFPVDFQSTGVYLMTVVNGFILLIRPDISRFLSLTLLLRCAAFPFIAYFSFVFLPFLPLSIFAILAIGLGFLMLTPLALGIFQMRVTQQAFISVRNQHGNSRALLLATSGLLLLPGYFTAQATLDKQAIDATLDYFYAHDLKAPQITSAQASRSAQVLVSLRDRKAGIQMPYLSAYYNKIVFGDLVLTDKKIARTYRLLTNNELPQSSRPFFATQFRNNFPWRGNVVPPATDVAIEQTELRPTSVGTSTLQVKLRNNADDTHSLYIGRLKLAPGVFITGLKLKIEGEWTDGQIFDRKTALWVFQKITEVRRDPALIYYTDTNEAELRVYPFPKQGIREVEIELTYHPTQDASVELDDVALTLNSQGKRSLVMTTNGATALDNADRYTWQREPYLHFILDYSASDAATPPDHTASIVDISRRLGIEQVRLSAANITTTPATDIFSVNGDSAELSQQISSLSLEPMGSLWIQQAIATEMIRASKGASAENIGRYPIFVVLAQPGIEHQDWLRTEMATTDLHRYAKLIPDTIAWHAAIDGELTRHCISTTCDPKEDVPVVVVRTDTGIRVLTASDASLVANGIDSLEVWDTAVQGFQGVEYEKATPASAAWTAAATAWAGWWQEAINPGLLEERRGHWLAKSREANVLLPETSFIVVEAPSQWEILRRKEQQAMNNHGGLEFQEEQTSEPLGWLMLLLLVGYLYYRSRKRTHHQQPLGSLHP